MIEMTSTTGTKVARASEKPEAEVPAASSASAREVLPLSPTAIEVQLDGHSWKECLVRAHASIILQDLQDSPTIWRKIQSVPGKALRVLDRVTVIAFDMSWMIRDAVVIDSDATQVKLAIRPSDIIRLGAQSGTWQDDRHIVRWVGTGYGAFRLADGVSVLASEFSSLEAAKSALFAQHYTIRRAG